MKKANSKFLAFIVPFILFLPLVSSNGGCIKIADDVFVQMSHAPQVPKVNEKTSFLFSFGNDEGLINEEISGQLSIIKGKEVILINDFQIKNGVLDLKHEFNNAGIYEIFIDFDLQNKAYSPEDFVIGVIEGNKASFLNYFIFLIVGFLIGILSARFMGRKK
jgi:hypothetical protein